MSKRDNLVRFDLSDYLIHFVRPIRTDRDDAPQLPEHWGWGNVAEDPSYSPFFLLRCILRHRRIWASWSVRAGRRTIYGPVPAVCFTEMPLAAFLQSSQERAARGEKMSPYGMIFPKDSLFQLGARPVIYGLSVTPRPTEEPDGTRMLADTVLPAIEQYRYVAYDPGHARGPDWSHEREWRWPCAAVEPDRDSPAPSWEQIPGLDFLEAGLEGLGVLVRSERQAKLLVHDVLRLVDQGIISTSAFRFILTLEGLPPIEELWRPEDAHAAAEANTLLLSPWFEAQRERDKLVGEFFATVANVAESRTLEDGELGGCWLWLYDNTHPLVRSLIQSGSELIISRDGRYLVPLPEFGDSSLREREELTRILADRIRAQFDLPCGYFSVLGSDDPDGVPFYCDALEDNSVFFNVSWDATDY